MIIQARLVAEAAHVNQKRADGRPYMDHVNLVHRIVKYWMQNNAPLYVLPFEETLSAALLHDTVEDHPSKLKIETIGRNFGTMVAQIIQKLNNSDFDNYLDYLLSLRDGSKEIVYIALLIKKADMLANYYDVLNYPSNNKHQMKHLKNKAELSFYIMFHQKIWERAELQLIEKGKI